MRRPIAVSISLLTLLVTAPLAAQNYTGTWLLQSDNGGTVTLALRQDGAGNATGTMTGNGATFQLTGERKGPELVGKATGNGSSVWFEASLDGNALHLVLADVAPNGQPDLGGAKEIIFTRSGTAPAAPAPRAPQAGPRAPAVAPAPPAPPQGSAQDQQLRTFLLSSPWCSFSYNQTTGTSRSSRSVFLSDGILMIGTNREGGTVNQNGGGNVDLSGGATGSYYNQSQGGQQARWQVQGGQLYVDMGQGMQVVAMQITRNSNGYPIVTAGGIEYSQCQ
ncbi:MAG: hypothetical protein ABI742_08590 [Gemmatimonadota bacterium]